MLLQQLMQSPFTDYAEKRYNEIKSSYVFPVEHIAPQSPVHFFDIPFPKGKHSETVLAMARTLLGSSNDLTMIPAYGRVQDISEADGGVNGDYNTTITVKTEYTEAEVIVSVYYDREDVDGSNGVRNTLFLFRFYGYFCVLRADCHGAELTVSNSIEFTEYKWMPQVVASIERYSGSNMAVKGDFTRVSATTIKVDTTALQISLYPTLIENLAHLRNTLDTETIAPQLLYPSFFKYDPHTKVNFCWYPLDELEHKAITLWAGVAGADIENTPYESKMGFLLYDVYQSLVTLSANFSPNAEKDVYIAFDKLDAYITELENKASQEPPEEI